MSTQRWAGPVPPRRSDVVTLAVAGACAMLVGLDRGVYLTLSAATVVGALLAPVWLSRLSRYSGARLVVGLALLSAASGVVLSWFAVDDHHTSDRLAAATLMALANLVVGTGLLLWARTVMPAPAVAALFGLGMLGGAMTSGRLDENVWRFGFSVPVTITALALAWAWGRRWLEITLTLVLGVASALAGGRSTFAMLVLAAAFTAWQAISPRSRAGSRARVVMVAAVLVFGIYQVGQGLILDGYLGENAQERSQVQIAATGNILLGSRPEMGATVALFVERPWGFGAGTLAGVSDVGVAKQGMASLGYDPDNGYVERYMFGQGFVLHSVLGDTWAAFGLVGIALVVVVLWCSVGSLVTLVQARVASALVLFLGVRLLWNAFFSPLYSSTPLIALTLGLLLPERAGSGLAARAYRRRPSPEPAAVPGVGTRAPASS